MMGEGTWENLKEDEQFLDLYKKAIRMHINVEKYILSKNGLPDTVRNRIKSYFPYSIKPLSDGSKYLGFFLKPNAYSFKDWMWLYKKIEGRIGCWTNKFLSREGRLVLLNAVLQSIPIYWATQCIYLKSHTTESKEKILLFLWSASKQLEVTSLSYKYLGNRRWWLIESIRRSKKMLLIFNNI